MVGMNKFDEKSRRAIRRQLHRNHIARDLHSPKYHTRVKEPKRRYQDEFSIEDEEEEY